MHRWILAVIAIAAIPLLACGGNSTLYEQARTTPFQTVAVLGVTLQATSGDPFAYSAANSATVTLPDDAKQGVPGWFVLDATLRVTFKDGAPADAIDYATVSTNGFAVAMVEFRPYTAHLVRWASTEQFTGAAWGVVQGKTFEFRYRNYLQLSGVKGGSNTVTVHVEHLGAPLIERVELLAGSSIDFTALPPSSLSLERADAGIGALSARVMSHSTSLSSSGRMAYPSGGCGSPRRPHPHPWRSSSRSRRWRGCSMNPSWCARQGPLQGRIPSRSSRAVRLEGPERSRFR